MEKYGFIYLWYDRKHKRFYLGCHWGTENDGYICSSTWMKQGYRHRPQDFKRKILKKVYTNKKDLLEEEYRWLSMIKEEELRIKYYNLHNHHFGHWITDEISKKTVKQKISESVKLLHQDPDYKKKYLEGRKKMPPPTKEVIEKRAAALKGRVISEETKKKIGEAHKGKIKGPLSDKHKEKLSVSLSGEKNPFYGKTHRDDFKEVVGKKISETMKGRIPSSTEYIRGTYWWNNGVINKRSVECPGEGYHKGKRT